MDDAYAICVRSVSKAFCRHLRRSMLYGTLDLMRAFFSHRARKDRSGSDRRSLRPAEFWALDRVSLNIPRGEVVGIVGANGSGKTTMLRLIAGIFPPDHGEVQVRGRVGALIALGAGFHPHMTGRENVYLNGSILGISKEDLDSHFAEIVEFADVAESIEAPVSTYSSGMRVRLGFSIAIHARPEIMLVDEVLSVGDLAFQRKAMDRMKTIVRSGRTILFVSHNIFAIQALCDRVIWMDGGQIKSDGPAGAVIARYREDMAARSIEQSHAASERWGSGEVRITRVEIQDQEGEEVSSLPTGSGMCIRTHYVASQPIARPNFGLVVMTLDGVSITYMDGFQIEHAPDRIEGEGRVDCRLPALPFGAGREYSVYARIMHHDHSTAYDAWMDAARFRVDEAVDSGAYGEKPMVRGQALVSVPYEFSYS